MLSKTRFQAGLQCPLRLYYGSHHPGLATPPDAAQQARFDSGTAAGIIAQGLRPGGVAVRQPAFEHDQAVARTRDLLGRAEIPAIYEAAFTEDGVRVRADILARADGGAWDLIEVKSSTSVKPEHVPDAAVQLVTLEQAGVAVRSVSIARIDNRYVYPGGSYDAGALFAVEDISDEAREYAGQIPELLAAMKAMLVAESAPEIDIGRHCSAPYECEFTAHCRRNEPVWAIDELPRLSAKRVQAFRDDGVRSIVDVPASTSLSAQQERVRESVLSGKPYSGPGLGAALERIVPPAHFIDFETMMPALPAYVGTRPYQTLPFQWSDHVLHVDGTVTHHEFLAEGGEDPRREFAATLIAQLEGAASVVVYSDYEARRLRDLQEALPDLAPALEDVLGVAWVDLLKVVRDGYYHPNFHGSFSLKAVLPALVPDFGYGDLDIQQGELASLAFLEVIDSATPPERREQLRDALLAYCGRDTEAMLRVVAALQAALQEAL